MLPCVKGIIPAIRESTPLEEAYARYNALYFGGKLKTIPVRCTHLTGNFGHYNWDSPEEVWIDPSICTPPNGKLWHWTLLHEMAHVWERQTGGNSIDKVGHSLVWQLKMLELANEGAFNDLW